MSRLVVNPILVQQAQKAVDDAQLLYTEAKDKFLQLLAEKYDWENKLEKGKDIVFLSVYVDDLLALNTVPKKRHQLDCKCKGAREEMCKLFENAMSSLQPQIDLAFMTQHEAAQQLLDAKGRLSDTLNGYPIDYDDSNYN